MAENRSLDEFAGEGDVEPIEATYEWTPGGAPCGACGRTVEARWRDGEERVCADCKEW